RWNDASSRIQGNRDALSDRSLCDPLLDGSGKPNARRRLFIQRVEQRYNAELRRSCATDLHCRYDGRASLLPDYHPPDVAPLAAFPPSPTGLARFAATAGRVGFDFSDRRARAATGDVTSPGAGRVVRLAGSDDRRLAGVEYSIGGAPFTTY